MLREIGDWLIAALEKNFKHMEFYEGQFEKFDQVIVYPPACFLNYGDIESGQVFDPLGTIYLTLHLITSKLTRDPEGMLDLVETVVKEVNNMGVHNLIQGKPSAYIGRCFFNRCRNNTTFPGLLVWDVELRVERT